MVEAIWQEGADKRKRSMFTLLIGLLLLFAIITGGLSLASRFRSAVGGLSQGGLADCPTTPNCVCSQASREDQRILPFAVNSDMDESLQRLRSILRDMTGATIVRDSGDYLHVEFRSPLFQFVDDAEFYANRSENRIEVRSASRIGYGDLNANRRRIEQLRDAMQITSRPAQLP